MKHLLVFADGHVEDVTGPLLGMRFIRSERLPDGSHWEREFEVRLACQRGPTESIEESQKTMVGIERGFRRVRTAAQVIADDLKHRDELLRRVVGSLFEP